MMRIAINKIKDNFHRWVSINIFSRIKFNQRRLGILGLLIFAIIFVFFIFTSGTTSAAWYDSQWQYRKKMVFNNSAQSTNLTNFPVMIALTSSNFDFTQTQSTGYDIRFTDANGTTILSYERELFDVTNRTATFWVNVPQINATSNDDFIYMYWGNPDAIDGQNTDNAWNSNYKGVYHLDDNTTSTAVVDSSGNGNDLTTAENTTKFTSSTGQINSDFVTAGTPTTIKNQDGSVSEVFPDIELDSNGYPVIAYTDYTDYDLLVTHCNDKDCKGDDESLQVVYAIGTTGYYPSLKLDANGYPVIAFYDSSGGNLMLVHCNDVNCAGSNESIEIIESTNDTGYYPSLQLDGSGYPVISYYYGSGADLKLVHCNDVNCAGSNENINTVDSTGTVGNYQNGNSLVLDGSGYPVIAYNDDTNNDLKIAHCNDANCAGSNESLTAPLSVSADDSGLYSKALQLDGSGYPMVSFANVTATPTYYSTYLHCSDANCTGDQTANRVTIYAGTAYYSDMKKNSSGNPVFFIIVGNVYPYVYSCTTTACSSITSTALSLYNQVAITGASLALDTSNNVYAVSYNYGEGGQGLYDTVLYTTESKIARSYDSDFNFGTGSFSASMWFKSNSDIQQNFLLSRYDADQGYKIWLNYAGQPCFGIDDDASWGPDDSACTTPASITQNIDNGNASSATYVDFVLDSNGYPVIAYLDATPNDLELIHCNDANCSGANESYVNVDTSANSVGHYPSIKLDGSGKPVIAYYDATDTNLKVVHCGDVNCSTGNVINAIDVAATSVGAYPALQLDSNGYPVIGYYDTTNTAIKLVHCNDVNCSGGDESIVTVDNTEYDIPYLTVTWMQLDGSGYPVMAYTDLTNYNLKVAHCTNANCTGVTLNTPDSTNTTGYYPSLQLDGSGYPIIAYQYASGGNLRLMHCNDANCAGTNETISTFSADTLGYNGYYYIDLDLTSAGYPVISHTQYANWNVLVTVCNDVNCAGNDEVTSEIREDPYNYLYASLELDTSNKPVVLTRRAGDLGLLHFSNTTSYTDTNRVDTNTWRHLVAVKNGTSSISLYLDGVLAASDVTLAANGTLTSDSAVLRLAEDMINGLSVYNWSGHIDEVQIDATARSADWAKAQYLSESNNYVNIQATEVQGGPVGYFKFDETIYPVAHNTVWQKTGTNTNLVLNPSVEVDLANITTQGAGTISRVNSEQLFGNYAIQYAATNAQWNGWQENNIAAVESTQYTGSAWVKPATDGIGKSLKWWTYDQSGNYITEGGTTVLIAGWQKLSFTFTTQAGDTGVKVALLTPTGWSGGAFTFYTDGIQVELGAVANLYCDGSLIGSGNHAWNGTAHGSASTCDTGTDADISDGVTIKNADQCVANGCLAFNGSTGNVTINDPANHVFDQTDALTIEAWIRPINAGQNNYGRVIANVSGVDIFVQNLSGNTLSFCAQTQGTTDSCTTNSLRINEWNHIAVVYTDGNSRNFYINGKLDTSNDSTNNLVNSTSHKVIGNIVGGTRAFNGSIDEVKIYPYARSTNQVNADFNDSESNTQSMRGSSGVLGSNANNSSVFTDGLVGYWKMDEAVANTCTGGANDSCDSSGNAIDGAWLGNATAVVGKFGNGVSFDNAGDVVGLGSPATLDFGNNGSFTFAGWIKPTTLGDYDSFISKNTTGRTSPYSYMTVFMANGGLTVYNSSAWITLCGAGSVVTGSWQHVVFNYNGTTITGYVNGKSCGSVAFTYPDNSAYDVSIGSWYAASTAYDFNGVMDDVRIYNRTLSSNEIKDLYNQSKFSVTGSVSLSASVKPSTVGTTAIGGVVASKGENYQLSTVNHPSTGSGSRSSFSTNAITTQLSGTNINDIYFYDTTKDSVDPSWRFDSTKSWYTETIDATYRNCDPATHDRCGNKEFPEKAYIVATDNNVYIFDAAENAMWMRFDEYGAPPALANAYILGSTTSNTSSIYMMNGLLYISKTSSDSAWNLLYETKFISDSALYYHVTAGNSGNYNSTIVNRNAGSGYTVSGSIPLIVARNVNDVHAAVISGKTYVAVATDGGISLINETDNTVANMAITVHVTVVEKHVYLTTNNVLYFSTKQNNSSFLRVKYNASALTSSSSDWGQFDKTYAADQGAGNPSTPAPAFGWSSANQNQYSQGSLNGIYVTEGTSTIDGTSNTIYAPSNNGVTVIQEKQGDETNGSVKYLTKDYITEEMIGDIRGMWSLNGSSAIANAADIASASVNATTMTASNANGTGMTYATGVRGTGITFDGTDDYLKQKVYYDQTGATFGPTVHGLNMSSTAAFYRAQGRDLSTYHGTDGSATPYMLVLKDSALKTAWGYIGSTDATEALGAELVLNGSFTTDTANWTAQQSTLSSVAGGQSGNALQVQNVGAYYSYAYQAITTVVGKLYKVNFYHKNGTGAGNLWIGTSIGGGQLISNVSFSDADWALKTYYFTATTTTSYIRIGLATSVDGATTLFDEVGIKEVTDVGVDGVHIVSAKNGGTRTWAGIESGFNYNDSAYTFEVRKTDFQLTTGFSVGLWVKPNTTPQYIGLISKGRITGDTNGWSLEYNASNKIVIVGNSGCTTSGSITTSASAWTHIVAVANSSTNVSLYANGVLQDTSNFACGSGIIDTFSPQVIGKTNASPLTGTIDEPFVTAEALTADQIKRMYEVGRKALQNEGTSALNGSSNQVNAVAVSGLALRQAQGGSNYVTASNAFIGTEDGGVSVIDLTSDTLMRAYTTSTNPAINHVNINALTATTDGNFIAALDSGLSRVNGVSGNQNLATTKFTDVVGVFDKFDGYYKLYENNSLVGKTYVGTTHSPVTNMSKLAIGGILPSTWTIDADNPLPTTNFYGAIDNVNIYDYAVNPRELNISSGNGVSDPALYLPFEEGEGVITSNRNWQKSGTTTNLITNPSFEVDTTDWTTLTNGILTKVSTGSTYLPKFGNSYAQFTPSSSAYYQATYKNISTSAGQTYIATAYIDPGSNPNINFVIKDYNGSTWQNLQVAAVTSASKYTLTGTTRTGALYIVVGIDGGTSTAPFYFDAVQMELRSTTTPYCDGSLKGNGTHTWSGTAHASTSTCEYGTDAELINGVTWQNDGAKGKSLRFDGVDDYVKTSSDILKTPAAVSVSGWFRTGAVTNGKLIFSIEGYYAMYHHNGQLMPFFDGSSGGNSSFGSGLNNNQWHHFVAMNNGTTTMLYVDGKSIASFTETLGNIDTLKNGVGIGSQYDGTLSQCFNGDIDEIKIFPYELTPSEIKVEYNLGAALKLGGDTLGKAELSGKANSDGLVGYWKMDEAGSTLSDSSGNGYNGTATGTTVALGKYGNSRSFVSASSDRILTTGPTNFTRDLSLSAWVYQNGGGGWQNIFGNGDGAQNKGFLFSIDGTRQLVLSFSDGSASWAYCAIYSGVIVPLNQWTHVAITRNGGVIKIFMNGVVNNFTCGTNPIVHLNSNQTIGYTNTNSPGFFWNGNIDDVRTYNRALSDTEIRNFYNLGTAPVAEWRFDENQGTTAKDSSENSNNGVLTSGPIWVPGVKGSGLSFDGSDDYVITADNVTFPQGNVDFAVTAWVNLSSKSAIRGIATKGNGSSGYGNYEWDLRYTTATDRFRFTVQNGSNQVQDVDANNLGSPAISTWYYIHAWHNSINDTINIQVNGGVIDSAQYSFGGWDSTHSVMIGRSTGYFAGTMDNVRIFNYVLTPYQIAQEFNGGKAIAQWSFDEGSGQSVHNTGGINSLEINPHSTTIDGSLGGSLTNTNNDPDWVTDETGCKKGKCLDFEYDSSQYLQLADNVVAVGEDLPWSYSTWINAEDFKSGAVYPAFYGNELSAGKFQRLQFYLGTYIAIEDKNNSGAGSAYKWTHGMSTGQWNSVTVVCNGTDSNNLELYINGVSKGKITMATTEFEIRQIGTRGTGTMGFDGKMDDVKVFNYALSADDILREYNQGAAIRY